MSTQSRADAVIKAYGDPSIARPVALQRLRDVVGDGSFDIVHGHVTIDEAGLFRLSVLIGAADAMVENSADLTGDGPDTMGAFDAARDVYQAMRSLAKPPSREDRIAVHLRTMANSFASDLLTSDQVSEIIRETAAALAEEVQSDG